MHMTTRETQPEREKRKKMIFSLSFFPFLPSHPHSTLTHTNSFSLFSLSLHQIRNVIPASFCLSAKLNALRAAAAPWRWAAA
jgi:hypothetical protein